MNFSGVDFFFFFRSRLLDFWQPLFAACVWVSLSDFWRCKKTDERDIFFAQLLPLEPFGSIHPRKELSTDFAISKQGVAFNDSVAFVVVEPCVLASINAECPQLVGFLQLLAETLPGVV